MRVTIVSKDLRLLYMRIKNPHEYWSMHKQHFVVRFWIISPPPTAEYNEILVTMQDLKENLFKKWTSSGYRDEDQLADLLETASGRWYGMTNEDINMLEHYHALRSKEMRLVRPPGTWAKFVDVDGENQAGQQPLVDLDDPKIIFD
nr:hypothetical protein B0A51_10894 [Rachicladosporium sp. CCFEE 5018]